MSANNRSSFAHLETSLPMVQCSSCKSTGESDDHAFMSKSQRKKPPEKQRCVRCVLNEVSTPEIAVSQPLPAAAEVSVKKRKLPPASSDGKISEMPASDRTEAVHDTEPSRKLKKVGPNATNPLDRVESTSSSLEGAAKRLEEFYAVHNPARCGKLASQAKLLAKFEGRESLMFKKLHEKYAGSSSTVSTSSGSSNSSSNTSNNNGNTNTKSGGKLVCDKCDGAHDTASCPHFKKAREAHPDAQRRRVTNLGADGGSAFLRNPRVKSQPGDGSCLFHSIAWGLARCGRLASGGGGAHQLRHNISKFWLNHPDMKISDTPVSEWVKWDSGLALSKYCQRMARGGIWGGGIELAGCSLLMKANVHVWEKLPGSGGGGVKRISCFDYLKTGQYNQKEAIPTIHVLYRGGIHYDALVVDEAEIVRTPPPVSSQNNSNKLGSFGGFGLSHRGGSNQPIWKQNNGINFKKQGMKQRWGGGSGKLKGNSFGARGGKGRRW